MLAGGGKTPKKREASGAVFFPGCALRASAPNLAAAAFAWLRDQGRCGSSFSGCCGMPSALEGDVARFERQSSALLEHVGSSSMRELVTACPSCYYALSSQAAKLGSPVRVTALPAALCETGVPVPRATTACSSTARSSAARTSPTRSSAARATVYALHDSCPDREQAVFARAVRTLLDGLVVRETLPVAGAADVGVPATAGADGSHARCCGKGVEGYGRPEDEQLAMAAQRIAEAQAAGADVLVTACGTCARALTDTRAHAAANAHASTAPNCGTSTLRVCHYLELLFDRQEEW